MSACRGTSARARRRSSGPPPISGAVMIPHVSYPLHRAASVNGAWRSHPAQPGEAEPLA